MNEITKILRVARVIKGLKQIDVADYIGVKQARYSKIETGAEKPTISQGILLARLLKLNVSIFEKEKTDKKRGNGNTTHGETGEKIYNVWQSMKARCCSKNLKEYKNYGGRGVTVCKEWIHDYVTFRDWAFMNGYDEGLEIDRINNDGNYEPNNCRFVTKTVNNNNKRSNHIIEYKGEKMTLSELARQNNIDTKLFASRIFQGWDIDRALTQKKQKNKKSKGVVK